MKDTDGGNVPGRATYSGKETLFCWVVLVLQRPGYRQTFGGDRIPFHGCTNMHSALDLVTRVARVLAGLSGVELLLNSSRSMLGEPAQCANAESACARRRSIWATLMGLGRAIIGELKRQ